jgi:hypothetical protein
MITCAARSPIPGMLRSSTGRTTYCDELEGDGVAILRDRCETA